MLQRNNNVNCITQVQPCNQLSQNLEVLLEDNKTIITVWVKISLILVVTYHSNNIGTLYCRLFTKRFFNENKIFMVNIKWWLLLLSLFDFAIYSWFTRSSNSWRNPDYGWHHCTGHTWQQKYCPIVLLKGLHISLIFTYPSKVWQCFRVNTTHLCNQGNSTH